jgi:hypothetical protein
MITGVHVNGGHPRIRRLPEWESLRHLWLPALVPLGQELGPALAEQVTQRRRIFLHRLTKPHDGVHVA